MKNKKKELLFTVPTKDFEFKATRGTGSGGQKKNKTSSAIQCFHRASGSMGYAEDSREQSQNRKLAFKRCTDSLEFKTWIQLKIDAAQGKVEIEEADEKGNMTRRKVRHEEI